MSDYLEFGEYTDPKQLAPTLQEGEATFKIIQCIPSVSKEKIDERTGEKRGGNPMFVVTSRVTDANGTTLDLDDYLIADKSEAGLKRLKNKINQLARSIGRPHLYAPGRSGIKPEDILGFGGKCYVKTQAGVGNFPDRSVIAKYLEDENLVAKETTELVNKQIAELDDQDIPF